MAALLIGLCTAAFWAGHGAHAHRSALVARAPHCVADASAPTSPSDVAPASPLDVAPPPVLSALFAAVQRAAAESSGVGGESSGSGRPEWGTWCDKELFGSARDALDAVGITTSSDGGWGRLWAAAGGERPSATVRVGGGRQWDVLLHLFSAGSRARDGTAAPASIGARHADGVLSLLKPVVGSVMISKRRPSGQVFGSPRTLTSGVDRPLLQLGGPAHTYEPKTASGALLEVVMRHEVQQDRLPPGLPSLDASLLSLFRNASAPLPAPPAGIPPAGTPLPGTSPSSHPPAALPSGTPPPPALGGSLSSSVGGLEAQLDAIVRRVLASRADVTAARRLGVSHVRGVLLSGPPGCGKTLLARELARSLGAREPQVVNGPEVLDKFVGEAEARIRALFAPAEAEWAAAGDASALHVIILDEMDAIARTRGSASGDSSGVRDSVVNQLLSKMDGVNEAGNVLVIGLTNRPELLDEALLRPGRLEVQLKVELPDAIGRRDILRIHTRAMRANGALAPDAAAWIDADPRLDDTEGGQGEIPRGSAHPQDGDTARGASLAAGAAAPSPAIASTPAQQVPASSGTVFTPARPPLSLAGVTAHFSGAELAGLVRSAASFALDRAATAATAAAAAAAAPAAAATVTSAAAVTPSATVTPAATVTAADLRRALTEVRPALGKRSEILARRFSRHGVSSPAHAPARRAARRLAIASAGAEVRSAILVGEGPGAGVSALAAWAAAEAVRAGEAEGATFISLAQMTERAAGGYSGGGSTPGTALSLALIDVFREARAARRAAIVLDDVDGLFLAGGAQVEATLRSLLREPLETIGHASARAPYALTAAGAPPPDTAGEGPKPPPPCLLVYATATKNRIGSGLPSPLFDLTIEVPMLRGASAAAAALRASPSPPVHEAAIAPAAAAAAAAFPGGVGVRELFRAAERAAALAEHDALSGEVQADEQACAEAGVPPQAALQLAALSEVWGIEL